MCSTWPYDFANSTVSTVWNHHLDIQLCSDFTHSRRLGGLHQHVQTLRDPSHDLEYSHHLRVCEQRAENHLRKANLFLCASRPGFPHVIPCGTSTQTRYRYCRAPRSEEHAGFISDRQENCIGLMQLLFCAEKKPISPLEPTVERGKASKVLKNESGKPKRRQQLSFQTGDVTLRIT